MTEKRYIYASVGVGYEILDSWFGYIGDSEPTEREIEEYDFLVIGLAPDQDSAEGICRRLNDQQDEIEHLSNFGLHVILDKKNKEIEQLKKENLDLSEELDYYKTKCASLETGLFQADKENGQLRKENKELQSKASSWKITASEQIMEQSKLIKENDHLKALLECSKEEANDIDRNCYNCKHCSTYDEGPGYGFVSLCEKDCMNTDGYFDYEYHKFKSSATCPFWECGDDI